MAFQIGLDLLDGKTPADKIQSWLTYTTSGQSFDLLVRMASGEEQRAHARAARDIEEAFSSPDWWLSHVSDWREIHDRDGQPIAFDASRLRRLWDIDPYFGPWLMRECQRFGNFRDAA